MMLSGCQPMDVILNKFEKSIHQRLEILWKSFQKLELLKKKKLNV